MLDLARGTDADGDGEIDPDSGVADVSELVTALGNYPALLNALDDENTPYTVFAPNNEAFPEDAEADAALENTLSYHVATGQAFDTQAVAEGTTFPLELTTAQGGTVQIVEVEGGGYAVVDSADNQVALGQATLTASAAPSAVYVIDQVLTAPEAMNPGGDEGGDEGGEGTDTGGGGAEGTALAAIEGDAELSTFAGIVNSTGLTDNLGDITGDGGSDNYITRAPSNAALEGSDAPDDASAFVLRHITVGSSAGATLSPGQSVRTNGANAVDVVVGGTEGAITVNGNAATLITSGATPGGQVYKIDGVL